MDKTPKTVEVFKSPVYRVHANQLAAGGSSAVAKPQAKSLKGIIAGRYFAKLVAEGQLSNHVMLMQHV